MLNRNSGPEVAPDWALWVGFLSVIAAVLVWLLRSVSALPMQDVLRRFSLDADSRAMRQAAKSGEIGPFRAAAHALVERSGLPVRQFVSLRALDTALFSKTRKDVALGQVMTQLREELHERSK